MLFDEVVDYSSEIYLSFGNRCGNVNCNHPSGNCSGNCANCLRQVHFGPNPSERVDYDCEKLIYKYVIDFTERYKRNMQSFLSHIDMNAYPRFNILSIGCGAAPDLMAFEESFPQHPLFYRGFDRNPKWYDIHTFIEGYAKNNGISAYFNRSDIFNIFLDTSYDWHNYNVIVVQYLISHLYNTGQSHRIRELYDGFVKIVSQGLSHYPFLIVINDIDSYNKGRNLFHIFLNMLEDAGFVGTALAYSSYPNGDLGKIRWGASYRRLGQIDYNYRSTPFGIEGAALIIEITGRNI